MARIRRLPDHLVNRIAAGEVVERPASVVKELVENALDAGATRITVTMEEGGRDLVLVEDDGYGMEAAELPLALERHATSKLRDEQLVAIDTLGFRGEALPSIAAVAELAITSRTATAESAWRIRAEAGAIGAVAPAAGSPGTRVEVRNLFFNLPARRKFLKSPRSENGAALEVMRRLAMAAPGVRMQLLQDGRRSLDLEAAVVPEGEEVDLARIAALIGRDFAANAFRLEAERDGITLVGYAGLPTLSRNHARHQYLFVNGRPVQDRLLRACLRAAYSDLLFRDRQPVAALFLRLPAERVDVNVHPQKSEVRFREPELVRGLVIGALKRALAEHGHRSAVTVQGTALGPISTGAVPTGAGSRTGARQPVLAGLAEAPASFDPAALVVALQAPAAPRQEEEEEVAAPGPLGRARAQILDAYILAENAEGLVIVDQHAAHERIVYEGLKAQLREGGVARQLLLMPEVVELEQGERAVLLEHAETLAGLGILLEPFGDGAVIVREMPALLGETGALAQLLRDVVQELESCGEALSLRESLERVLARMACHGSIRAGRRLSVAEMDALLRQIEQTPYSAQCNHGRPTYITLDRSGLERLFARR